MAMVLSQQNATTSALLTHINRHKIARILLDEVLKCPYLPTCMLDEQHVEKIMRLN